MRLMTLILTAALLTPLTGLAAGDGDKPLVAVIPFDNHTPNAAAGMEVADAFIQTLFQSERYTIVHPAEAIKVMMGHKRGCLDVDEREEAQALGKELGCDAILIGDVGTVVDVVPPEDSPDGERERLYEVSARLLDIGSGDSLWLSHTLLRDMAKDPAFNDMKTVVTELAASLMQKYPGCPPKEEDK
jgi:hypothetical protein